MNPEPWLWNTVRLMEKMSHHSYLLLLGVPARIQQGPGVYMYANTLPFFPWMCNMSSNCLPWLVNYQIPTIRRKPNPITNQMLGFKLQGWIPATHPPNFHPNLIGTLKMQKIVYSCSKCFRESLKVNWSGAQSRSWSSQVSTTVDNHKLHFVT